MESNTYVFSLKNNLSTSRERQAGLSGFQARQGYTVRNCLIKWRKENSSYILLCLWAHTGDNFCKLVLSFHHVGHQAWWQVSLLIKPCHSPWNPVFKNLPCYILLLFSAGMNFSSIYLLQVYICGHVCALLHTWLSGDKLFPPCVRGGNSGHQAWWQAPLPRWAVSLGVRQWNSKLNMPEKIINNNHGNSHKI